jgi:general transcription factor 3C polypeptide 3 (transcription factor C subunit 4)
MGECFKYLGNLEKAAECYTIAIAFNPEDVQYKIILSDIYKDMGNTDEALKVLETYSNNEYFDMNYISKLLSKVLERDHTPLVPDMEYLTPNIDSIQNIEEEEEEEEIDRFDDPDYNPSEDEEEEELESDELEWTSERRSLGKKSESLPRKRIKKEARRQAVEDIRIIARKGWILFSTKKYEEFIRISFPFIKSILDLDNMIYVINPSYQKRRLLEVQAQYKTKTKKKKLNWDEIEKNVNRKRRPDEQWTWNEALYALGSQELFYFLLTTCKAFAYTGRYEQFVQIMDTLLKSSKDTRLIFHFSDEEKIERIHQLRYLYIGIAFNNEDYSRAYKHLTQIIREKPYSIPLWNLFNMIVNKARNLLPSSKFAVRLLAKYPTSVPLMVLVAHNCSMSGSYRLALGEYFRAYRSMPDEPIICLCIGINYLNLVMNRRTANRHLLVMQAFTFLYKYYKLRNGDQEANFNLARAYHQIGVNYLAVIYYNRVLELSAQNKFRKHTTATSVDLDSIQYMNIERLMRQEQVMNEDLMFGGGTNVEEEELEELPQENQSEEENRTTDLCREAAYNLCLIYNKSGNLALVQKLMHQYLTV